MFSRNGLLIFRIHLVLVRVLHTYWPSAFVYTVQSRLAFTVSRDKPFRDIPVLLCFPVAPWMWLDLHCTAAVHDPPTPLGLRGIERAIVLLI